ncbi:MAG: rod shape-determining protein MreD [Altererythrobacter sp.]|nr:rod shape-determining protein MreD [Altererythrobacter sp.]OJU59995.1 MAG: rod shape-determining protein MreD [Altererythrobacter sp. 66-12]
MEQLNPRARRDPFGSRINRTQSSLLAYGLPWVTIMLGSLTPWLPIIAPAPLLPPLGFMLLLAWRLLRPGLLPLWAGLPLGLFDDLYSGQPLGSGVLLFSLSLFAIEVIEARFPWRNFWLDWLTASAMLTVYIALAALFSGAALTLVQFTVIIPQLLLSIVLFPIIARAVAMLDRLRLMRVRRID